MATARTVTPNRRGAKSREAVLDAAERVMASRGYDAATVAAIVEESGIPMSSVYHYYGSKEGVLLAVMERGAERFFEELPEVDERLGEPLEHLELVLASLKISLARNPDFLRLVVVMATQPRVGPAAKEVQEVVARVREQALERLRTQLALAFDLRPSSRQTKRLAQLCLALIDGGFVALQAGDVRSLDEVFDQVPAGLVAMVES